jgi:enamine deaminase RidA (YjgF/YER057c/UK114 family)
MIPHRIIRPDGWPRPSGYSDAIVANAGRLIAVAGQIGWNPTTHEFESDDFVAQSAQALRNVVAVLAAAGAAPSRIIRLTWYVTDRNAYLESREALGDWYQAIIGPHYPAQSMVVVAALIEPRALVEIEATAIIPSG